MAAMSSWPACWVGVIASRTVLTQALALGPPLAVVLAEAELLEDGRELLDDDAVVEDADEDEEDADSLVEDVAEEVEVVAPPPVSDPHPTRARTARPAAARGRWLERVGMPAGYPRAAAHRRSRPTNHMSHTSIDSIARHSRHSLRYLGVTCLSSGRALCVHTL